jgi:hypothetical protein
MFLVSFHAMLKACSPSGLLVFQNSNSQNSQNTFFGDSTCHPKIFGTHWHPVTPAVLKLARRVTMCTDSSCSVSYFNTIFPVSNACNSIAKIAGRHPKHIANNREVVTKPSLDFCLPATSGEGLSIFAGVVMARHSAGYVRLYRKILEGKLRGDGHAQAVFGVLLCWANRKDGVSALNKQGFTLKRGQVVTSLHELHEQTGFARTTLKRVLERLQKRNTIGTTTSRAGTVITINNYDKYQAPIDENESEAEHGRNRDEYNPATKDATNLATYSGDLEKRDLETISLAPPKKVKKPKAEKERLLTWTADDPYAKAFENLKGFAAYWAIFELEKERSTLDQHRQKYELTIPDIEQITYDLRHYMDGPKGDDVASPRGKLATFVKGFAERRATRPALSVTQPDIYAGIKFRSRA